MGDVVINLFPNFTFWKLQTLRQYLLFFLVIGTGILIFYAIIRKMKKARTPEGAMARVTKALRAAAKDPFSLLVPRRKADFSGNLVAILPQDIVILQVEHFGYRIQGSYDSAEWSLGDNAGTRFIQNPLPGLRKDKELLEAALKQADAAPVTVHTLVVFADNYAEPDFRLDDAALPYVVSTKGLKKWLKKYGGHPVAQDKRDAVRKAVSRILKQKE